jgi:hypothetical protein
MAQVAERGTIDWLRNVQTIDHAENKKGLSVKVEQIDVAYGETGFERRGLH